MPAKAAGKMGFVLGGPVNHGPGLWNWDHKDFSPRIAVAWAPNTGDGWVSKILGKKDEFTVRGGYSITYNPSSYASIARRLAAQPPAATTETIVAGLDPVLTKAVIEATRRSRELAR